MPSLRVIKTTASQWGIPLRVPAMLRPAGAVHSPEQASSGRNAGGDRKIPALTWPGRDLGIRAPGTDETPLSEAEVRFGIRAGLIDVDLWPMVQIHREAGSWEKRRIGELAKPGPWEGLL